MLRKRIAIDLGTANSLVMVKGKGIVLNVPTVVAYSKRIKKVIAIGEEAKLMLGKSPEDIVVERPLKEGVIASYRLTEAFIKVLIRKSLGKVNILRPEVMISVPAGLTSVEERAVIKAANSAGASKIYLIPEPIAAAIGAKLPIAESSGNMIVNIGGGTAEIAIISLNGLVKFTSKRGAGDAITDSIRDFLKRKYKLEVGEQMAEKVKIEIGSCVETENPRGMQVRGSEVNSGQPKKIDINSNDIVEPIKYILSQIVISIKSVLETTPPELVSDIIDRGIALSGGSALISDIDIYFTDSLGVAAYVVDNPFTAVVEGVCESLESIDVLRGSLKS
ncbi:rod shape-determining protein [Candidatus Dojkabacteria bacterium]|nr:rod shape-determining protein [Candidatus Dojkabacteria bacterium]